MGLIEEAHRKRQTLRTIDFAPRELKRVDVVRHFLDVSPSPPPEGFKDQSHAVAWKPRG